MATETGTATRWPAWLTPNLRVLCGVSFLADTASELVYPILPIFLTTVLGAPTAAVGAVEDWPRPRRRPPRSWPDGSATGFANAR